VPPSTWRSVQLIEIPDAAPPYDCETHGAACPVARDHAGAADEPATMRPPGPADWGAEWRAEPRAAPVQAAGSPTGAGSTAAWPRQFAQVMVEILAGVRPARQITPWTTDRVRSQVRHLGSILATDRCPRIQRIMTSQPTASVVEMTIVVSFGPRTRALAMRFEHVGACEGPPGLPARPARWLCTELETG